MKKLKVVEKLSGLYGSATIRLLLLVCGKLHNHITKLTVLTLLGYLRLPYFIVFLICRTPIIHNMRVSLLSLNATFSIVILIITAVLTQISMALKVVVYLSERRDSRR